MKIVGKKKSAEEERKEEVVLGSVYKQKRQKNVFPRPQLSAVYNSL